MLGLEVDAPLDGVVELVAALLENVDGLGVAHAAEVVGDDVVQTLKQSLVDKGVEELHLLRAALHRAVDDVFHHRLGGVHVVVEVGKGHFRLYHPELGGMALSVGYLGAEGRAEGVHVAESHGEVLGVELAGDGQASGLAEEILAVIYRAVLLEGEIVEVKRRHAEHLARALTVGAGDDRGVDVYEAAALEEFMDGLRRNAPDAEGCGEEVGSGAQMLDRAQELNAVALFLEGVVGGRCALDGYRIRLQLKGLLCFRSQHKRTINYQRRTDILLCDLIVIIERASLKHDLQRLEAAAVIKLDESKVFQVADGSDPAADSDLLPIKSGSVGKYTGNFLMLHNGTFPFFVPGGTHNCE